MLFSPAALLPFGSRAANELAILSASTAGSPTQIAALTPTVINPFRLSPITLSILLANAIQINPLQGLFPLSWNLLVVPGLAGLA